MEPKKELDWKRYPEAWKWINEEMERFAAANPSIARLGDDLTGGAGARLVDVVDHLIVSDDGDTAAMLEGFGYVREKDGSGGETWTHPGSTLPRIAVRAGTKEPVGLAVKVDDIARFLLVRGMDKPIQGTYFSRLRKCEVSSADGVALWAVERRTSRRVGVNPIDEDAEYLQRYFQTLERWQTRRRSGGDDEELMEATLELAERQVGEAGADLAAYLFFEAERRLFESRNRAAQVEKRRLDLLGMGWANCDHHTYRSSRELFSGLLKFFKILGFDFREKFWAGEEAGWGAQVAERPAIGVALFLDVDLSPDEIELDFLGQGLAAEDKLGTVGLWCALHGDSLLKSGLHHLALRSDFDGLTETLAKEGVKMMKPFSDFSYLKQAFTYGEKWRVEKDRLERLEKAKAVAASSLEKFAEEGAVGSHIEDIQRTEGYKGFSQKQVSEIIKDTDPERYRFE